jgi:acyl carrier protein
MPDVLTRDSIEQQLCTELQALLSLKPGAINPDTALAPLGVDSLKFVSLLLTIEQKFGVSLMKKGIKPQDLTSVRTLAAAIEAGRSQAAERQG